MTSRPSYSAGNDKGWLITNQRYMLRRPMIMGILNVTSDSFSDGGKYCDIDSAVEHALNMVDQGADIIDVGGESTRPGAQSITTRLELSRVIPVIQAISKVTDTLISIDTQKSTVALESINAGARIINDVSGGIYDEEMYRLVASSGVGYVMMHMQGKPETMQVNPHYDKVLLDIQRFFMKHLKQACKQGIQKSQIVIDPGIGFGKSLKDNLSILANIREMHIHGHPILVGASRKSFIGMLDQSGPGKRLGGSLAAILFAYLQKVQIFRVHDVEETRQSFEVFTAIQKHSD